MKNDEIKELLEGVQELPPMPKVAWDVLNLLEKPDYSFSELVSIISRDTGITVAILKLVNSPFFGSRVVITNLTQAISLIGTKHLKNLVIALSTKTLFEPSRIGLYEQRLWEHSVATAIYARVFALKFYRSFSEEAFIIGLLHDIGQIVLSLYVSNYEMVKENVFGQNIDIYKVERELLDTDHMEIGKLLLNHWGLPELYSDVISTHHYSDKSKYTEMGNLIYIANNKVKEHGFSIVDKQDDGFYEKLQTMGYEKNEIEEIDSYFLEVIKTEKELLQV